MTAPSVTNAEVDKAFYDSYRDSKGSLDPRLLDKNGNPRPLTTDASDGEFVKEWIKIRKHLQEKKGCSPPVGGGAVAGIAVPCATPPKDSDAPPLDLSLWNDGGAIEHSTNCYAYAMNSRTGHVVNHTPQPGYKSGSTPGSWDCAAFKAAVLADGKSTIPGQPDSILLAPQCPYQKANQLPPPKKQGYYLVALVITSNNTDTYDPVAKEVRSTDYHWFRQDANGLWSQKQGTTPAKTTDESGAPISNPQTCNRKEIIGSKFKPGVGVVPVVLDYDVFCGYFYVRKGGAEVKG